MIIAIVVIVLLVVGGGGVAYAALHKGGTTPVASANIPINVPTSAPTSAPTQRPASTPVPAPAGATAGQTLSATFAKVFVPAGYTVSDQEDDYVILTPNSGDDEAIGVQAEPLTDTRTNAELDKELLAADQQNGDPSAKLCSAKAPPTAELAGSGGAISADVISICENLTPPNGPAFAAVDAYIAGVAKARDGSFKAVWFEILAPASGFQAFTNSIPPSLIARTAFTDASPLS